jgi:hypothetical protein
MIINYDSCWIGRGEETENIRETNRQTEWTGPKQCLYCRRLLRLVNRLESKAWQIMNKFQNFVKLASMDVSNDSAGKIRKLIILLG